MFPEKRAFGTGSSYVGGLVGLHAGTVSVCYATGEVTADSGIGGLIGSVEGTGNTVSDSYWDTQTSEVATSAGGTGKTTAQMKQQATFAGWDFATTWMITENVTYPLLRVGWDSGYQDIGGGWRRLSWFGDYVPMGTDGWIWHNRHGFFFVPASSTAQHAWLYTQDMGWLYTGDTIYPFLFRASDGAWLWYNGSTNPRWFVNMGTGQWENHY